MSFRPFFETDLTPSVEIIRSYRRSLESGEETDDVSMAPVHHRATDLEFILGIQYVRSADPLDRATGAHVLSQLGWGRESFREESIQALLPLLADPDPRVLAAAAVALGHRSSLEAVPALSALTSHPDPEVRSGIVSGLSGLADPAAIRTLINLSRDPETSVRDWATFGIGSLTRADSPEIRQCLHERLSDADSTVRGEALVGLAERADPGLTSALRAEWKREEISLLSLEAAAISRCPDLLDDLLTIREICRREEDSRTETALAEAILACTAASRGC